jgi:hypothetical protein
MHSDQTTVEQHRCIFDALRGLSDRERVGHCQEWLDCPKTDHRLRELLLILARAAGVWDYVQRGNVDA